MEPSLPLWRRLVAPGLALLGFALILPAPVAADVELAFDPPNGFIMLDANGCVPGTDTLTVRITVDTQATDLKGFSFVFEFDSLLVAPVSVEPGTLLSGGGCSDYFFTHLNSDSTSLGDSVAIDGALLGCSVSGPGSIAELRFVARGQGVSPLRWRAITLRDSQNAGLPNIGVDGEIEADCPFATTQESWGRIKTLYRSR